MVPGRDTRATEGPCLATPLLIGGDALGLKPLMGRMPFERFALSNVIEDGPGSEMVLLMDSDELESLSERGMYILSVEEPCVGGGWSMGGTESGGRDGGASTDYALSLVWSW